MFVLSALEWTTRAERDLKYVERIGYVELTLGSREPLVYYLSMHFRFAMSQGTTVIVELHVGMVGQQRHRHGGIGDLF